MLDKQLQLLFNNYLIGFKTYDIAKVEACYHLPCTLHTPDRVVLLTDKKMLQQEFADIFSQLQQTQTANIIPLNASYSVVNENLFLVCIDWQFMDQQQQIFTEFSAHYYLIKVNDELKIVNVVSHELNNSLNLASPFVIVN